MDIRIMSNEFEIPRKIMFSNVFLGIPNNG